MNFRTISQLPSCDSIIDKDLIEVSKYYTNSVLSLGMYDSYCMSARKFSENMVNSALAILSDDSTEFGYEHHQMWEWLNKIVVSGHIDLNGDINFTKDPTSNSVLSSFYDYDLRIPNVESIKEFSMINNPLFIGDSASFNTSYFNVENNLTLSSDEAPSVNGEKHNEYLFRITNTTSNIWKTTDSGVFSCYGWVDEATEGPPENVRRWIALEGKINGSWKILQLQPVIPNLYCSYVGFTFPVGKGLELRLRTGFKVGTNSNKYQSTQGSLTNHIANAFIGGVYKTNLTSY